MTALFLLACALAVTVRIVCVGIGIKRDDWHRARFVFFVAGAALKVTGALAIAFGKPWGAHALLAGCALILADRRKEVGE